MPMKTSYQTVSEITTYIKNKFSSDNSLQNITIRGEIANLSNRTHFYFTLKDQNNYTLKAVLFKNHFNQVYLPSDGDDVLAFGDIEVYPQSGQYQLIVRDIMRFGEGARLVELEKLRKKLQLEGLFDDAHKRPIPQFPKTIGVITAKNGAAIHDITKTIIKRFPIAKIEFFDSSVQGKSAPKELIDALNRAATTKVDVIIIGRGGGSSEDLYAFNDEELVRSIFACKIPVIAAVGHESDTTLVDYVASFRASTPTHAAVIATPNIADLFQEISNLSQNLDVSIQNKLNFLKQQLNTYKSLPIFKSPTYYFKDNEIKVKNYQTQLRHALQEKLNHVKADLQELKVSNLHNMERYLNNMKLRLINATSEFKKYDPNIPLELGYSLTVDENNKVIRSIDEVNAMQLVKIILKDGKIVSSVIKKEKN